MSYLSCIIMSSSSIRDRKSFLIGFRWYFETNYIHLQHQYWVVNWGSREFFCYTQQTVVCYASRCYINLIRAQHSSREDLRKFPLLSGERGKEPDNGQRVWRPSFYRPNAREKKRRLAGVEKSHRDIKKTHFQPTKSKCKALQGGTNDFNLTDSFGRFGLPFQDWGCTWKSWRRKTTTSRRSQQMP